MSAVHDTITEHLRSYALRQRESLPGYGDDPTAEQVWWDIAGDAEEGASRILAALSAAGFVVRKRVEPAPEPYAPISRELLEEARNDPANHALRNYFDDTLKAALETPLEQP